MNLKFMIFSTVNGAFAVGIFSQVITKFETLSLEWWVFLIFQIFVLISVIYMLNSICKSIDFLISLKDKAIELTNVLKEVSCKPISDEGAESEEELKE